MEGRPRPGYECYSRTEQHAALRFLEYLPERGVDPVLRPLAGAPEDDEPLIGEDREALRKGKEDVAAGRVMSTKELLCSVGIER